MNLTMNSQCPATDLSVSPGTTTPMTTKIASINAAIDMCYSAMSGPPLPELRTFKDSCTLLTQKLCLPSYEACQESLSSSPKAASPKIGFTVPREETTSSLEPRPKRQRKSAKPKRIDTSLLGILQKPVGFKFYYRKY